MAHERLRFNIILKEENDDDQNKVTNTSYDPIYSDIKYNTHFGIFANFTGKKQGEDFMVNKINFLLQNYSGEVTIGLNCVIGIKKDDHIDDSDDYFVNGFSSGRHIKIFLLLQGLSNNFEASHQEPFLLKQGDFIEVITIMEPIENKLSKIDEYADVRNCETLFVDSEYMFRDGEEVVVLERAKHIKTILSKIEEEGYHALQLNDAGEVKINSQSAGFRICKMKVSDVYIR